MLGTIDINSLAVFAEAGLVIFLGVFVAVTARALRAPRREMTGCARLPLEDGPRAQPGIEDGGGA